LLPKGRQTGAESIAVLARKWQECRETIAHIFRRHADIEAGRVHAVEELFAELGKKLSEASPSWLTFERWSPEGRESPIAKFQVSSSDTTDGKTTTDESPL